MDLKNREEKKISKYHLIIRFLLLISLREKTDSHIIPVFLPEHKLGVRGNFQIAGVGSTLF